MKNKKTIKVSQPNVEVSGKLLRNGILLILGLSILSYLLLPGFFNLIVYRILILKMPLILPLLFIAYILATKGLQRRPIILSTIVALLWWVMVMFYITANDYNIYHSISKFEKIDSLVESSKSKFRYTPKSIAYSEILGNWNESAYTVDIDKTHPYFHNGMIGYISPIIPHGIGSTFARKVLGVAVYNDTPQSVSRRDTLIKQEFKIGEGMLLFDNLYRNLCAEDRFAVYEDARYLSLNGTDEIVTISPIIKYSFHFPFSFTPFWHGLSLVHHDGRIEMLTKQQAITDPRLTGQWIAPVSLARKYVNAQNARAGFMPLFLNRLTLGLYTISSLIEISKIDEGDSEYPHISISSDNKTNMVVAVEPAGEGQAIKELYYLDGHDLTGKVYMFDPKRSLIGPVKAQLSSHNLSGYLWKSGSGDKSSGVHVAIEPTELVKNQKLYWKLTVTTDNDKSKLNGDVLVIDAEDPDTPKIKIFKSRASFYTWLNDSQTKDAPQSSNGLGNATNPEDRDMNTLELINQIKQHQGKIQVLLDSLEKHVK